MMDEFIAEYTYGKYTVKKVCAYCKKCRHTTPLTERFIVRCTEQEKEEMKRNAENLTISNYVRLLHKNHKIKLREEEQGCG